MGHFLPCDVCSGLERSDRNLKIKASAHNAGDKKQHQANREQGHQEQRRYPSQQKGAFMLRPGRRDPKNGMTQAHQVKKKVHRYQGSRGKVSG
jgi:hypothetical protein